MPAHRTPMKMKRASILVMLAALLGVMPTGCKSRQASVPPAAPAGRQPMVEVAEATLQQEGLLIDAKTQQLAGNEERARSLYGQILKNDDRCAAAHYELGAMLLQAGALDSALVHCRRATELEPGNVWYLMLLADLYEQRYDTKSVAATWESIVAAQPDKRDHYYQLSDAYLKDGNGEGAIDALDRAEKRWGIHETVSLQKQRLWNALGKPQKALEEVERLARSMPENTEYNALVAEAYMKQKDYKRAKTYYDNIAKHQPDNEYIHISLANYYKLTGDPQKAMEELCTGFRNPGLKCIDKMQILASFYTGEEFYKTYAPATFDLADTLIRYCDDSSSYALFYADIQMRRERYAEALPWIRLHLQHDSSQYEAWEALLICESVLDQDTQLVQDARKANSLFPLHLLPYYLLALDAHNQKDYATALGLLERCRKLGFQNGYLEAECYGLMAECYYRTGQPERAWKSFDHYLTLHPDDIGILNNYAYYLSEQPQPSQAQLQRAEQMSRRTLEAEPHNATYLDTYAWILHRMGRDKEALPYMKQALDNDTQQSETLQQHYQTILGNP